MRVTKSRIIWVLLASSLLGGCQTGPQPNKNVQVEDLSLSDINRQNEQITAAIHLLETGDSSTARTLVQQVLNYNADHPTAKLLNVQLTQPAAQIFNTTRVTDYQVKSGDSLGLIAQRWLGNSLYFVSLARLNHINKPSSLQPGSIIKIPVTEKSHLVQKEQVRSGANLRLIGQFRENQEYYTGLEKSNSLFIVDKDLPQLYQLQRLLLNALMQSAVSLSDREKMLQQVSQIATKSRNSEQRQVYTEFINTQRHRLLVDEALLLFEDQSYTDAAERLIDAKKIEQAGEGETRVFRMQSLLLNKLHEQAVVLYRNHSLQEALDRWNLILKLDPENELAQKYTERTQKLLKKLNQY